MLKELPHKNWYNLKPEEVIGALNSSIHGLTEEEAKQRLAQFGPNKLPEKKRIAPFTLFLSQFKNFLIILLLSAIVMSIILGEIIDAVVIATIVIFCTTLGFIQEYKAERALAALKKLAAPSASVLRDYKEKKIEATKLVPGDIILLRVGDKIAADARLIEAINLKANEAPLTGESLPVDKVIEPLDGEVNLGERNNMVFKGTTIVYGRGKAVVTATGKLTEFGKIAAMLQELEEEKSPLQLNLDRIGKYIGIVAIGICLLLTGIGIMRGFGIIDMFMWGVALAVAAVPESLPAVVVISLALGLRRMVRRNALIRKLSAVETLGCTSFICSDKTGTLTQDKMLLRRIYVENKLIEVTGKGYEPEGNFYLDSKIINPLENSALEVLLKAITLCNDTSLTSEEGRWEIKGEPTEGALLVAAAKAGFFKEELSKDYPRIDEIPFSPERKRMTTLHQMQEYKVAYSKGAPEIILNSCNYIFTDGKEKCLTSESKENILSVIRQIAEGGMRVLGVAYKRLPNNTPFDAKIEEDMVFVGLVGVIDPPREEVKEAVKLCENAGIKSVMITGDHKLTAIAVAKELGILKEGIVVTGTELDNLNDDEFHALVEKIEVYARVSPAHKLRVVKALAKKNYIIAMTGDGVNDAPALKKADIGIAMGITGTDVTKEASDMILTDDNFASIVAAVEEGRNIFFNIKKYLMYLLSTNFGELALMLAVLGFGGLIGLSYNALPLVAIQILWINLATDGLPAIALSVDPVDPDIMRQKPRPKNQGFFSKQVIILIIVSGLWLCSVNLWLFKWALESGRNLLQAQCLCFLTLLLMELFKAYNFRSDKKSIFKLNIFNNKWLNLAVCWEICLILVIVYTPFLHEPFHTFSLNLFDWLMVLLLSVTIFFVLEVTKVILRKTG